MLITLNYFGYLSLIIVNLLKLDYLLINNPIMTFFKKFNQFILIQ